MSNSRKSILIDCTIVVFAILIIWFRFINFPKPSETIYEHLGDKIVFDGIVKSAVSQSDYGESFSVLVSGAEYNILVRTNSDQQFDYGNTVHVQGVLEEPASFTTDQGTEFDYKEYLKADKIYFIVKNAKVSVTDNHKSPISYLYNFVNLFEKGISDNIPPEEAGLANGIILGDKNGISKDLRDVFITTGTIHIVALSGFNVSIVAKYMTDVFAFLIPFRFALYFGFFGIVIFVIMTGLSATAVRAGIMGELSLLSLIVGRPYRVFRALLIASLLMLSLNPMLLYSVSFQLSVFATLGIIFIMPILQIKFARITNKFLLRDTICATLGAQIAVMPLIAYHMHQVSIVSFFANILISPIVPYAMLSAFILGFFAIFLPHIILLPFIYVAYALHHFIILIVSFFAKIPYANTVIQHVPLWLIIIIYFLIFGMTLKYYRKYGILKKE